MSLQKKQKNFLDIKKNRKINKDILPKNLNVFWKTKKQNRSVLLSHGKIVHNFFTEDSGTYITPKQVGILRQGWKLNRQAQKWDCLGFRVTKEEFKNKLDLKNLEKDYFQKEETFLDQEILSNQNIFKQKISILKLWNLSIVASILFGMFSMTLIYRYLGQGAQANEIAQIKDVSDEEKDNDLANDNQEVEDENFYMNLINDLENKKDADLEKEIQEMVKGYPIEEMASHIATKDRIVAAFLIGIARKESNWGKRVPLLNGQDCYNYWGYRGVRKLMGTGGHTCFNSRNDAVDTVAKRLENLIEEYELTTPSKMIIWKCGSSCAGHSSESVRKWIADVNMYFGELN